MSEVEKTEVVDLEQLVGEHILTAVETGSNKVKTYSWSNEMADAQTISFTLDGVTYTAVEDPDDGYRSHMKMLFISDVKLAFQIPETKVIVSYNKGENSMIHELLEFRELANGKLILEVGTKNTDDYYPWFCGDWNPKNLSINEGIQDVE